MTRLQVTSRDAKTSATAAGAGACAKAAGDDPYGGRELDDLEATVTSGSEMQVMVPLNS